MMGRRLYEIEDKMERELEDERQREQIERGEIPDPLADFKARLREIFSGVKIKAKLKAPSHES